MRLHMRPLLFVVLVGACLAVTGLIRSQDAGAQATSNAIAVDADPSSPTTVETSFTVNGTGTFDIGLNTTVAAVAYKGYQVEVTYPDAGLNFISTTINAGSPFQACQTPNQSTDGTNENVQDGCAKTSAGSSNYVGQLETVQLQCASNGTFTIHLVTLTEDQFFGTTTLDANSSPITTTTQDATVTCTGVGPVPSVTNTAGPTSTNTPLATATRTNTPAATATNTSVPTSTNTPLATATRTNTPASTATNTSVPTSTNTPAPTNTSQAATATNTSVPTSTNTPAPTNTSQAATATNTPVPTSTNTPAPTNTSQAATATNTPVPTATNTPAPTNTARATNTAAPTNTATATRTAAPTGTPGTGICPDFNNDGFVSVKDLLILLQHFGQHNQHFDLNGDGYVTAKDIVILVHQFGRFC